MSISDLEKLSYRQVRALLSVYEFVNDAIAYAQDDEAARKGAAAFFA